MHVDVLVGELLPELSRFVALQGADLVAIEEPRRRITWRAPLSERLARSVTCPVLIVRSPTDASRVPAIEPPCAMCVAARKRSRSETLWCSSHAPRRSRLRRPRALTSWRGTW
jgi:hypothetical protein